MAKGKKKNGRKLTKTEKMVLATATLNLIKAVIDLIRELLK